MDPVRLTAAADTEAVGSCCRLGWAGSPRALLEGWGPAAAGLRQGLLQRSVLLGCPPLLLSLGPLRLCPSVFLDLPGSSWTPCRTGGRKEMQETHPLLLCKPRWPQNSNGTGRRTVPSPPCSERELSFLKPKSHVSSVLLLQSLLMLTPKGKRTL